MASPNWIGRVRLPEGGVAVLKSDGKWQCDDRDLLRYLDLFFDPADFTDLGQPSGRSAVSQAAVKVGGRAEFPYSLQPLADGEVS